LTGNEDGPDDWDIGIGSLKHRKEMAMDDYSADYILREQFRKAAALDRQLTRWGWFQCHEHRPRKIGWRFRIGEALVRLGSRLQNRGPVQHAGTPGGL
jgi:hypothetical protein